MMEDKIRLEQIIRDTTERLAAYMDLPTDHKVIERKIQPMIDALYTLEQELMESQCEVRKLEGRAFRREEKIKRMTLESMERSDKS